jgi:hypothetical protein
LASISRSPIFFSEAPNKAFLTRVTSGRIANTITIDGARYGHLFFSQPPGIGLELWLPKNEPVAPRRLIVTYGSLPYYQPNALLSALATSQVVLTECKPDIARFCSQVAPGQGRIKACMKEHLREPFRALQGRALRGLAEAVSS